MPMHVTCTADHRLAVHACLCVCDRPADSPQAAAQEQHLANACLVVRTTKHHKADLEKEGMKQRGCL